MSGFLTASRYIATHSLDVRQLFLSLLTKKEKAAHRVPLLAVYRNVRYRSDHAVTPFVKRH